jgi:citrate synthase
MQNHRFLSAREATELLGISRNSLYAYVSRGRIRAEPDPRNPRRSRYLTADVHRLRDRSQVRREPEVATRKALDWGLPVLESSLTLVRDGHLYYRGRDVARLAEDESFEGVVRLLWNADVPRLRSPARKFSWPTALAGLPTMDRLRAILPLGAAADRSASDLRPERVIATGWRILRLLTDATTMQPGADGERIADRLGSGWRVRPHFSRALIDPALVLCADHELNVSTFAARVVASAGSSPYDAVAAGLGALSGSKHGGYTEDLERLFDEAGAPNGMRRAMAARLRGGETLPGFGHPLYPDGDPRARTLLAAVERLRPASSAIAYLHASERAGRALLGELPNVDFALVVLRRALRLPRGSALTLFAIGRTAGWIAHALEQYALDHLIRPRAAYRGPPPEG